jgi:8-oxo-dGTP pyrophosphatase MutT (NUDIX family)
LKAGAVPAIARTLEHAEPKIKSTRLAGVSVILDGEETPRTLLIKRAEREGDPWSGQIAFPGGKMNEGDESVLHAAIRETKEEVGLDLAGDAAFLGYLGSFRTHTGTMDVVPSVFLLKKKAEISPNEEVSDFKWVGLGSLLATGSRSTYRFQTSGTSVEMPAFVTGDYVIWGLTFRIIETLLDRLRA